VAEVRRLDQLRHGYADEAQELRDIVERETRRPWHRRGPFGLLHTPYTADPEDVGGYLRAGFDKSVLWGAECLAQYRELSLEQKIAGLERVAGRSA